MKLHYYPETDNLYIELKPQPGMETREVASGLNVDLDGKGEVVGFDIDLASERLELTTLETVALPLRPPQPEQHTKKEIERHCGLPPTRWRT